MHHIRIRTDRIFRDRWIDLSNMSGIRSRVELDLCARHLRADHLVRARGESYKLGYLKGERMRMRCCDICTTRKNCGDCPYIDGYVGPKTRMMMALEYDEIPDELSPDEIWALVDLVEAGRAGNGEKRKRTLGKWYRIVKTIVNRKADLMKRRW